MRKTEMYLLKPDDVIYIEQFNEYEVTVRKETTKTNRKRVFRICNKNSINFVEIITKYINIAKKLKKWPSFLMTYRKGFCISTRLGKNTLGIHNKIIAGFLKLSGRYTSHSGRRSGATMMATNGATVQQLMTFGGWTNPKTPQIYVNNSVSARRNAAQIITSAMDGAIPSTSATETVQAMEEDVDENSYENTKEIQPTTTNDFKVADIVKEGVRQAVASGATNATRVLSQTVTNAKDQVSFRDLTNCTFNFNISF